MSSVTAPPHSSNSQARLAGYGFSRKTIFIIVLASAVLLAIGLVMSGLWPFSQGPVIQDFREASDSQLQIRSFHRTYFPFPGCVLREVVFNHDPAASAPLITVEKITIRGTYLGLLSKRVSRITAEGLHITIPAFGTSTAFHTI